jgi:hypothetical protein
MKKFQHPYVKRALREAIPQSFLVGQVSQIIGRVAGSRVIPGQCRTKTRRAVPYARIWSHCAPRISPCAGMIWIRNQWLTARYRELWQGTGRVCRGSDQRRSAKLNSKKSYFHAFENRRFKVFTMGVQEMTKLEGHDSAREDVKSATTPVGSSERQR